MNFSGISRQSLAGRLLRFPLRFVPSGAVVRVLQGRSRGLKWVAGSSNHGCWLGSYEYEKRLAFERAVGPGDVVFDVGANVGFYTLLASVLVGPSGRVVAFEPAPRNLRYLEAHLRLNSISNVDVIGDAVSDTEGGGRFADDACGLGGCLSENGNLLVGTVTLDGLLASGRVPAPTHMKVDVEGADVRVLTGGQRLLASYHPTIFLATHGHELHRQCIALLGSLGYHLSPISGSALDHTDEILALWNGAR